MIKHLVFDFDGTISDSYPHFMQYFKDYAAENGLYIPDDKKLLELQLISVKDAFYILEWDKFIPYEQFSNGYFWPRQRKEALKYQAFDEAIELIKYAKQKGLDCYIYTHSGSVVPEIILPNMGIADMIDYVIDKSHGFPEKPAPDALLFLIEKFGLKPEECLMIGDRPIDAESGMNAGMKGCLWDARELYPEAKADYVVRSLSEIKNLI